MLEPTFADDRYAVFDDFLSPVDRAGVWRFVQAQRYERVHAHGWDPVWQLHDGEPLGSAVVSSAPDAHLDYAAKVPGSPALHAYPTRTEIDRLFEEVSLSAPMFSRWIGARGADWHVFTARAFLYPKLTGLGWHNDAAVFTGAFAYYAHPEWNCQWGGELFVARLAKGRTGLPRTGSALDRREESRLLDEVSAGDYLAPKPNRLVILRAGTPHRINMVHPAAGMHVRSSIAGFFLRTTASRGG